jgi:hypothetical protein
VPFREQLGRATWPYWSRFIEARREVITDAKITLSRFVDWDSDNDRVCSALDSLAAAESQLDTITADLCVKFLHAWRDDLNDWQRFSTGIEVCSTREAMEFLELKTWTLAEFGTAMIDSETHTLHTEATSMDHGNRMVDFEAPELEFEASTV